MVHPLKHLNKNPLIQWCNTRCQNKFLETPVQETEAFLPAGKGDALSQALTVLGSTGTCKHTTSLTDLQHQNFNVLVPVVLEYMKKSITRSKAIVFEVFTVYFRRAM